MSQGMGKVFGPAEAGRKLGCSASTAKRMAAELKLDPLLTQSGAQLFTTKMVERIQRERERRAREAAQP